MRRASLKHALATAALNMICGVLIAYAFAPSQLNAWWVEGPAQLLALLGLGLGIAAVVSVGVSLLPLSAPRFSPVGRVAANASFGLLLGLVGAASGFLVASVSLLGLAFWFSAGAAVMSIYYTVCPKGGIPNG